MGNFEPNTAVTCPIGLRIGNHKDWPHLLPRHVFNCNIFVHASSLMMLRSQMASLHAMDDLNPLNWIYHRFIANRFLVHPQTFIFISSLAARQVVNGYLEGEGGKADTNRLVHVHIRSFNVTACHMLLLLLATGLGRHLYPLAFCLLGLVKFGACRSFFRCRNILDGRLRYAPRLARSASR